MRCVRAPQGAPRETVNPVPFAIRGSGASPWLRLAAATESDVSFVGAACQAANQTWYRITDRACRTAPSRGLHIVYRLVYYRFTISTPPAAPAWSDPHVLLLCLRLPLRPAAPRGRAAHQYLGPAALLPADARVRRTHRLAGAAVARGCVGAAAFRRRVVRLGDLSGARGLRPVPAAAVAAAPDLRGRLQGDLPRVRRRAAVARRHDGRLARAADCRVVPRVAAARARDPWGYAWRTYVVGTRRAQAPAPIGTEART